MLRALLASRMTYLKATQTAAWMRQGLALMFGFIGLLMSPMLLLIGVFVWIAARQEASAIQIRSTLSGTPARAAMLTDFNTLQSRDTLAVVLHLTLQESQHNFPVTEQGRAIGILTRTDLLSALADHGRDHPITLVMRREFPIVESAEELDIVYQRLQECGCENLPVVENGQLVGLVNEDNLDEYLLIEAILQKRGARFGLESFGEARSQRV